MAFHVRDPETDALVRELARRKGVGLTEAIRAAVEEALKHEEPVVPLRDRLKAIAERVGRLPNQGPLPDKAFFDDLSGC